MSGKGWRRAGRGDLGALGDFLAAREESCAGFTGRLWRDGELRLPSSLKGGVWLPAGNDAAAPGKVFGAVLCHPSRLAFPVMPEDRSFDASLGEELRDRSWFPASAIGRAEDVTRFEEAVGTGIKISVAYRLKRLRPENGGGALGVGAIEGGSIARESGRTVSARLPSWSCLALTIWRAAPEDLDLLLPLQEDYEREEVLTPMHSFDPAGCRASLLHALREQIILVASLDGRAIGKAGTNARGIGVDQVGGVFTVPEYRGRGVARELMRALLAHITGAGRTATLFVKPANAPAVALYAGLGFEDLGDFRADYFDL